MKGGHTMLKKMASLTLGLLLLNSSFNNSFLAESYHLPSNSFKTSNNRSLVLKKWFKNKPPSNYKGKKRINYYPQNNGFIGVYL